MADKWIEKYRLERAKYVFEVFKDMFSAKPTESRLEELCFIGSNGEPMTESKWYDMGNQYLAGLYEDFDRL